MKLIITFFCFINVNLAINAQNKLFNEVVSNIKSTYPGYKDLKIKSSFDKYVFHIKNKEKDTLKQIALIFQFFNDNHLRHYTFPNKSYKADTIYERNYKNVIKPYHSGQLNEYWIDELNGCIIVINKENTNVLIGYTFDSKTKAFLKKGNVCFELERKKNSKVYFGKFNHPYRSYVIYKNAEFANDSTFIIKGEMKFRRIKKNEIIIMDSTIVETPQLSIIDSNTIVIKIPSCEGEYTTILDSLVKANKVKLAYTNHLIIDIRDNVGGYTNIYQSLLPYIYTNPIQRQSEYVYPTLQKINFYKERLEVRKRQRDSLRVKNIENTLLKMYAHINSSYYDTGSLYIQQNVMPYPKKVSLIVNYKCQSAAELMIMDFKQSSKVIVYGESTSGAVDFLDDEEYTDENNNYYYYIPTTKRVITKQFPNLENVGIKPDIKMEFNSNYIYDFFIKMKIK